MIYLYPLRTQVLTQSVGPFFLAMFLQGRDRMDRPTEVKQTSTFVMEGSEERKKNKKEKENSPQWKLIHVVQCWWQCCWCYCFGNAGNSRYCTCRSTLKDRTSEVGRGEGGVEGTLVADRPCHCCCCYCSGSL
jgi:hypothetical protein